MAQVPRIAVIGGINVDISGTSGAKLIPGDSNPGEVTLSLGGVGRNIAENLARLGAEVEMITALGDDAHTGAIRAHCGELGISLALSDTCPGVPNGTYLCLNDVSGDIFAAVSDMRVCERITPVFLSRRMAAINACSMVVADANLPAESLRYLAERVTPPLAADPVSIRKAERLRACLGGVTLLKPNRPEAELLTGVAIRGTQGLDQAADALLAAGVRQVFISLGSRGVFFADALARGIQPCVPGDVVNTNGCGDAFLAAACMASLAGADIRRMALIGQAAAAICAESMRAVSESLTLPLALQRAGL